MRIHAYVLAGDPAWISESVSSYYPLVDRIVVSYDATGRSWAGHRLLVDDSLRALKSVDVSGKMVFLPGNHADPERPSLEMDTEQRQGALDAASEGADWVLQLDTDEILLSPDVFTQHLEEAAHRAASGLDYPMRTFYQRAGPDRFLEHCRRFWGDQASFPGPAAVLAGTVLVHCRQVAGGLYRVDFRPWNTDPAHPRQAPVHAVIGREAAIAHLSWVRPREEMIRKTRTSGHAKTDDLVSELPRWELERATPIPHGRDGAAAEQGIRRVSDQSTLSCGGESRVDQVAQGG